MKLIEGKQGLVRDIGRFGKPRVREIGIPLYDTFVFPLSVNICNMTLLLFVERNTERI